MKDTIILFPIPAAGHLIPTVELANLLLRNFSVTIVILDLPAASATTSSIISSNPSITFHHLPPISSSPTPSSSPAAFLFDLLRQATPHLLSFLSSLTQTTNVRALILDFFCTDALSIASSLNLPSYFFISTSASNLAVFLTLPTLPFQTLTAVADNNDKPLNFPGLPPIHPIDLPDLVHDQNEEAYQGFMTHVSRLPAVDGIIVNTFNSLEEQALTVISNGLCLPGGVVPPVFYIGPLIKDKNGDSTEQRHFSLAWLDSQPTKSVVFLCFGSMGTFSAEQLKEIAVGLERSGQRFLWVVRAPRVQRFGPLPEPDLDELLPAGFVQRTEGRGLVVKSWAPQAAVLGHEAVGGFVTHCGWNSVLEAVSAGVPMIAWPLYAEQRMNKVFLVEVKGLAAEMKGYAEELVKAEEVEERVRWLMESEGGREVRKRATAARESVAAATKDGGSSELEFVDFVRAVKSGLSCKSTEAGDDFVDDQGSLLQSLTK